MKRLLLLGASGSIGSQTLQILSNPNISYRLVGFSVGNKVVKIPKILNENKFVKYICVKNSEDYEILRYKYPKIKFFYGDEGLLELIRVSGADLVINALVGFVGLAPSLETIKNEINLGLANKESLVAGGDLIEKEMAKSKTIIYPIDSEHVAITKCLKGIEQNEVKDIVLTCSGGPFYPKPFSKLKKIKPQNALKHPNWNMGGKITIDSATLINKVFEIVEAYYLFKSWTSAIKVLIHPESYVHSLVEFVDGTFSADIGDRDMKNEILYVLGGNHHIKNDSIFQLSNVKPLTFNKPDDERQKVLNIGYDIINRKGNLGTILVSADDYLVDAFINGKISFLSIYKIINLCLKNVEYIKNPSYTDLVDTKAKTILYISELLEKGDY